MFVLLFVCLLPLCLLLRWVYPPGGSQRGSSETVKQTYCFPVLLCLLPTLEVPPGGYRQRRRKCDSMFVFCLFVYFLSGYLQVGIDKQKTV